MEIRPAVDEDIPGIVALLKVSLGESLMPKSESYWRWKHVENPFGASPVLIALSDHHVVGVRAFMRWSWVSQAGRVEAVRAVDTATHPEFQGKGIFSQLTKAVLKNCEASGVQLVFNTPNQKSAPGYLKMGWVKAGNFPVTIRVVRPLKIVSNVISPNGRHSGSQSDGSVSAYLKHPGLPGLLAAQLRKNGTDFVTPHTPQSLAWRYADVPVVKYFAAAVEKQDQLQSLFFYRIKGTRFGTEFRITDIFTSGDHDPKALKDLVKLKAGAHHADFITAGSLSSPNPLAGIFSVSSKKFGPLVTIREIQKVDKNDFCSFTNWHPSLGDLELF
jgi:N-acetylglutamate synthase-like GNAT family acetyltransferase